MTMPGLPAGMDPYTFWLRWYGGRMGAGGHGAIVNLQARAQVLTKLVPPSVMRHLSTFQRSRLVLLVERIGEFGVTASRRALTGREKDALRAISTGINRIVAGARTAAAEEAVLSRAAQQQMQWVRNVNLRRAASRGIFGTLGVGGTIVLSAIAAIFMVGVIANARQTSAMEAIRAMNAMGADPQEIVFGTAPNGCVEEEAAARGLWWSAPDGEPCEGQADCSWRAPLDPPDGVPEPLWSTIDNDKLEERRTEYVTALGIFAAPRLAAAQAECGIAAEPGLWPIPTSEELCTFLPAGVIRLAQTPINDDYPLLAECVTRDGSGIEGVRMWAEVLAVGTEVGGWLSGVSFSINGSPEELDIGDRAWVIKSTAPTKRHVLAGTIGPVGYALYACSECDGKMIDDLEPTARNIVKGYLDWADTQ